MIARDFKSFIFESSRSKEISKNEFVELVKRDCGQWLENPWMFIRGKQKSPDFAFYPANSRWAEERMKEFSDIWYNYHIDYSPLWKEYPRRDGCIIGTNKRNKNYGPFFNFIIPVDGWKVAQVPSSNDLYYGMKYFDEKSGIRFPNSREFFYNLFNLFLEWDFEEFPEIRKLCEKLLRYKDHKYEDFITFWNLIDENVLEKIKSLPINNSVIQELYLFLDKSLQYEGNSIGEKVLNFIQDLMDPVKNEIELIQFPDIPLITEKPTELWTDSDCYSYSINHENPSSPQLQKEFQKLIGILK